MSDWANEWKQMCASAETAMREKKYSYAETLWITAVQEAEEFGPDDYRLAQTLDKLAEVYWCQGKFRQAEQPARQAFEMYLRQLGAEHQDVGVRAENLALIYHWQGKFGQAEPLYKQAIAIQTKAFGGEHPKVIKLLQSYVDLLKKTHREEEAKHFITCIDSMKTGRWNKEKEAVAGAAVAGAELTQTDTAALTPAEIAEKRKRWDQLAESARQAAARGDHMTALGHWNDAVIESESLGSLDHRLAVSLDSQGEVLFRMEKYGKAEMAWTRSLQIKRDVIGIEHCAYVDTLNNLAKLHFNLARYSEAEMYANKCVASYEKILGSQHPNVAGALYNLATLYHVQGKYPQAEDCYKRAIEIRKQVLGPEHADTVRILKNYAELVNLMGREEEAKKMHSGATGKITGTWKTLSIDRSEALIETCQTCGAVVKNPGDCPTCRSLVQGKSEAKN